MTRYEVVIEGETRTRDAEGVERLARGTFLGVSVNPGKLLATLLRRMNPLGAVAIQIRRHTEHAPTFTPSAPVRRT
jgi:hypothetical protein